MADKEEFTFRAGSVYELPLDKSLNMLQKELCSEYPDLQHKHFSRKMIQCAVRDLLIVEDEILIPSSVPITRCINICFANTLISKIQIDRAIPVLPQLIGK